jgi:hypothetical protein
MKRIARSWRLMKQSYGVLMQDKELMVLPILSGLCLLLILGSFVFGLGLHQEGTIEAIERGEQDVKLMISGFLFYVVTYTAAFFFQAAIVAGASERLAGGDPTLGSALSAAGRRFPAILMWGIIAATVGMILRAIEERSEMVGKIVASLIGAAWTLATFFMVPILVMEQKSVGTSFKDSWGLFKKTWGEMVSGNIGLGLASFLVMLPIILIAGALFNAGMTIAAIVVGVLGVGLVAMFFSALNGVWMASLYRYATKGDVPPGFDPDIFGSAFVAKAK